MLENACKFSKDIYELIWSQLEGTNFPPGDRCALVLAYIAVAIEHQTAISKLVESKLYGSAAALLRSQVETAFRGLWIYLLATDAQVIDIGQKDAEPFPRFREMADALDVAYKTDGHFAQIAKNWRVLNGYTHSGLYQLAHRFRDDGNLQPNYPDEMVTELLRFSGTISLLFLVPVFRGMGFTDKAIILEEWTEINGQTLSNP